MEYEKRQLAIYESTQKKLREAKRTSMTNSFRLTNKEQDAVDYVSGTRFYVKHQYPKVKLNVFDTKKVFIKNAR